MNTGTSSNKDLQSNTGISQAISKNRPTSQEVERLRSMLNTYKKKNVIESVDFQQETEKKDEEINSLKNDLTTKLKKIIDLENDNNKQKHEINDIKEKSIASEQKLGVLKEELDDLKEENESLINQQKVLLNKYNLLKDSLKTAQDLPTATDKLKETQDELNEFKLQYEEIKRSSTEKEYKLHECLSQNRLLKDQLEKNIAVLQEKDKKIVDSQGIEFVYKKIEEEKLSLETNLELERKINYKLRTDNDSYQEKQKANQTHIDQLERAVQHTRERFEEAELELIQLREDFRRSEEAACNLNEQKGQSNDKIDNLLKELQKTRVEKSESDEELSLLKEQFVHLKTKITDLQKITDDLKKYKIELEDALSVKSQLVIFLEAEEIKLKAELEKLSSQSKDDVNRIEQIELQKTSIDERLNKCAKELDLKEIEIEKFKKAEVFYQEKEIEYKALIIELKEKESLSLVILKQQIQRFEEELNHKSESLKHKETMVQDLNQQIQIHNQEKYKWQETLAQSKQAHEDQESRIRVAQQHLGKKLKEFAIVNERMEEMRRKAEDLQTTLSDHRVKSKQIEESYKETIIQEKKLQNDLQIQIEKLNEQKVQVEKKLQDTLEKLKSYAERQEQMQMLFANIQGVIADGKTYKNETVKEEKKVVKPLSFDEPSYAQNENNEIAQEKQSFSKSHSQSSIFEYEQKQTPIRQTFFD